MRTTATATILGIGFTVFSALAHADPPILTPADAFTAGKTFGQSGTASAASKVNQSTGSQSLPNFSTTAPQSANFGNGRGNLGAAGNAKLADCQNKTSSNPMAQQECDAVNFLAKNPSVRPKFSIDGKTDPLLTGSANIIRSANSAPGNSSQQCRVVSVTTPATFTTQVCTQTLFKQTVFCNRTTTTSCHGSAPAAPIAQYDCPVPAGGQQYCDDGACTTESFQSLTLAAYLRYPPSTCYYFILGNINSNGYLGALGAQFGIRAINWNQDYGRFELAATARSTPACPAGYTMVNQICLANATDSSGTKLISSDSSSPAPFQCQGGALLPGGVLAGQQTYACCTDAVDDGCSTFEAQTQ